MARRALYANSDIKKGEVLTKEMVKIVRHAFPEGVSAADLNSIIGRIATKDIKEHELLTLGFFKNEP